jgi:hypothetical protein
MTPNGYKNFGAERNAKERAEREGRLKTATWCDCPSVVGNRTFRVYYKDGIVVLRVAYDRFRGKFGVKDDSGNLIAEYKTKFAAYNFASEYWMN